jgi:hypothetical protein
MQFVDIQFVDILLQRMRTALLQTVITLHFYISQQTLMKDARRGLHSVLGFLHLCQ